MGTRGPVGKDPERRAGHRTKAEKAGDENVPAAGQVRAPAENSRWSTSAKRWYRSLKASAVADRYEPSDWALAQHTCDLMTAEAKALESGTGLNGAIQRIIQTNMSSLLTSIADRRRAQLEVRRTGGPAKAANVTPIEKAPGYDRDDLFG